MFKISRAFLSLILLFVCLSASADPGHAIHYLKVETATTQGGSFALPPKTLANRTLNLPWQVVSLPYIAPRLIAPPGEAAKQEIVTHWFRISLDDFPARADVLYLYVPRWQTIGKIAVYADSRLLYHSQGSPVWNGFNHPLWIPLAEPDDQPPSEILIRMDSLASAGAALSTIWVGNHAALGPSQFSRELIQVTVPQVSSAAFLFIGLFSFAVWLKRRKESVYLLFFFSSVLSYLHTLQYHMGLEPLPIPDAWFSWLTVNSLGWLILTIYFFSFRLHGKRYPKLERWLIALMIVSSALTLPLLQFIPDVDLVAPLAYLMLIAVVIVLVVTTVVASWRSRSKEALLFSAWNALNVPLAIHDWMLQNYLINIEGVYLIPYTVLGTVFLFMYIVFRRYVGAIGEIEQINENLERRLGEREQQLAASYERLRKAEREQVLAEERQRLVRDMHDGFGSSLVSTLAVLEHGNSGTVNVPQILRECIDDLKLIVDSLEPLDADLSLLLSSLRYRLEDRLEAAGITIRWDIETDIKLEWLTPKSALQIMRIAQEAFTNILKHADASEVRLAVKDMRREIIVEIEDNGKGFAVEHAIEHGGRGLRNMAHRARSIGASVNWVSTPGRTCLTLRLPVSPAP